MEMSQEVVYIKSNIIESIIENNCCLCLLVPEKSKEPESKQFVGLVIGILTTVIVMLLAAIMFIFYRNRRLKAALAPSTFYDQHGDLKVRQTRSNIILPSSILIR